MGRGWSDAPGFLLALSPRPKAEGASEAAAGAPWRDLGVRLVSALVLLPVGVGSIWIGGTVWVVCLSLVVAGMAAEWVLLWRGRVPRVPGAATLWVGLGYIALTWVSLFVLRAGPGGLGRVAFVMAVVWAGDIGAYVAGRALGGWRLAPAISPGKTWSGAAGGTLCAVLAGLAVAGIAEAGGARLEAGAVAFGLSVVAQLGDLLESAVKRRFGAKDSSRIIPGHGGVLDRLDGVLAAAPVALAVSLMAGPGPLWG